MKLLNLAIPPFPYYVTAGSTHYLPGSVHRGRVNIGVYDLIFVEHGCLYLTDNDIPYTISGGDYLILSANGRHFAQKPTDVETDFHWLHFQHSGDYSISTRVERPPRKKMSLYSKAPEILTIPVFGHLNDQQQQDILRIHRALISVVPDKKKNTYVPIDGRHQSSLYSQQLFLKLLDLIRITEERKSGNRLAENIMDYLLQFYDQEITLEHLSEVFHFHPAHILRSFKKEYDMSIIESLNNIRLTFAKELLANSSLSVAEIAAEVGFSSTSYFDRLFKKQNDISPKDYRLSKKTDV